MNDVMTRDRKEEQVGKRYRFVFAAVLAVAASCLVLGLFVAYNASQPVVSCAAAPKKPFSTPPVALVTAQDYFVQGDYDYEQGNCEKAISDYTRAIELNPNLAEAYNNRAYIYMVKKDYTAALRPGPRNPIASQLRECVDESR